MPLDEGEDAALVKNSDDVGGGVLDEQLAGAGGLLQLETPVDEGGVGRERDDPAGGGVVLVVEEDQPVAESDRLELQVEQRERGLRLGQVLLRVVQDECAHDVQPLRLVAQLAHLLRGLAQAVAVEREVVVVPSLA